MATAAAQTGRIPDFYVVGHAKCGTTALYDMLARHPQVFVGLKEPRYFATELLERDIPRPGGTPKTLDEYRAWFSKAAPEQTVGDVSPAYLWSADAARLIAEVRPDARIIAIFRDPARFLLSLHRQMVQVRVEPEVDFEQALALEPARRAGDLPKDTYWPRSLLYSDHVNYTDQLRRFHEHFPREQVLVLLYEEFRRENAATVARILRFIGVDDTEVVQASEANPSVEVRSPRVNDLLRRVVVGESRVAGAVKASLKAVTPVKLRQRALQETRKRVVFGDVQPPDERVLSDLRRRLAPEVRSFSDYLGQDLVALWGYEGL